MLLADVRHQNHALRQVQRALTAGRLPHAYLFHGPHGVGKEMFAYGLAQSLLCDNPQDVPPDLANTDRKEVHTVRTPCGQCPDCRLVQAGTHPDMNVIYRQLNREHPDASVRKRKALDIGVDVIRHFIIERIVLKPARGRMKVFIVREADRLTVAAQNALLKTLEEPPGSALLILLVAAVDRMLPTTLSRCQVVRFDALPVSFVQEKLAQLVTNLDAEQAAWYARSADGSLGAALERVEDQWYDLNDRLLANLPDLAPNRGDGISKQWLELAKTIGTKCRKRDPEMTETEATRRGISAILQLCALWYADVLREREGESSLVVNQAFLPRIRKSTNTLNAERCADAVSRIALTGRQLTLNANTQLCIETLVSDLARIARGETVHAGY